MFNIGPQELLLIIVVALVVVGPRRLPELGRTIGKGLREVRKAQDEVRRTVRDTIGDEDRPTFRTATPARTGETGEGGGVAGGDPDEQPSATSDVRDVSRTLGQSLSELRRAREDIRRSLRVEPDPPSRPARRRGRTRAETTPVEPTPGASTDSTEPSGGPTPATDAPEAPASPAEE